MPKPVNRLAKMLLESQQAEGSGEITKFGADQIIDIRSNIMNGLKRWDGTTDYDPLFEIAKLGLRTDNEDLSFKCHQEIAKYLHPQVRSLEIQSKDSKEIKITVEIADFARSDRANRLVGNAIIEPEDIEIVDDDDEGDTESALGLKEKLNDNKPDSESLTGTQQYIKSLANRGKDEDKI